MAGLLTGGAIHDASVIVGLKNTLDVTAGIVRTAKTSITGELFILSGGTSVEKALAQVGSGLDTVFLADPEQLVYQNRALLAKIGAKVVDFGAVPNKVHAKSLIVDGADGVVSTGAWFTNGGSRNDWLDLAVRVRGDAAKAVENLTRTRVSGDHLAFTTAAHEAAQHGIYINDPTMGVMELGTQVRTMIENASERLIIATKRTDSPEITGMLQAAEARGVAVTRYERGVTGKTLHGNVIIADDVAYIGSGMLNNRTLKGSGSSGRMARELGVMIDGAAVDDVARIVTTRMNEAAAAKAAKAAVKELGPDANAVFDEAGTSLSRRTQVIVGASLAVGGAAAAAYIARHD